AVDGADALGGGPGEPPAVLRLRDVGRHRQGPTAERRDLRCHLLQGGRRARAEHHVRPFTREGEGDVPPHPGTDSRDDGNPVGEQHVGVLRRAFVASRFPLVHAVRGGRGSGGFGARYLGAPDAFSFRSRKRATSLSKGMSWWVRAGSARAAAKPAARSWPPATRTVMGGGSQAPSWAAIPHASRTGRSRSSTTTAGRTTGR